MKHLFGISFAALVLLFSFSASAKISDSVWGAVEANYKPAEWNDGLETAHVNPDPSKFRGYVVVEQGGIAAERAARLISWGEYDYRGVTIDLKKETVKNRRGEVYTYLQRGDVMAVAKLDKLMNQVYVSLISPEVYKPQNKVNDKHFSRVTTTLVFKLPKEMAETEDAAQLLSAMSGWIKPFSNYSDAKSFAASINTQQPAPSEEKLSGPVSEEKK